MQLISSWRWLNCNAASSRLRRRLPSAEGMHTKMGSFHGSFPLRRRRPRASTTSTETHATGRWKSTKRRKPTESPSNIKQLPSEWRGRRRANVDDENDNLHWDLNYCTRKKRDLSPSLSQPLSTCRIVEERPFSSHSRSFSLSLGLFPKANTHYLIAF